MRIFVYSVFVRNGIGMLYNERLEVEMYRSEFELLQRDLARDYGVKIGCVGGRWRELTKV